MAEGQKFVIESVKDTTYLDQADQVIDGVLVRVRLTDFDEVRNIKVKNDNPELIRDACEDLVSKREKIDSLGG